MVARLTYLASKGLPSSFLLPLSGLHWDYFHFQVYFQSGDVLVLSKTLLASNSRVLPKDQSITP